MFGVACYVFGLARATWSCTTKAFAHFARVRFVHHEHPATGPLGRVDFHTSGHMLQMWRHATRSRQLATGHDVWRELVKTTETLPKNLVTGAPDDVIDGVL